MANPEVVQAVVDESDEILTYLTVLFAEPEVNYLAIALARERSKKKGKGKKKIAPLTPEQALKKERRDALEKIERQIQNSKV